MIAFAALSCRRLAPPWALGGTLPAAVLGISAMGGALLGPVPGVGTVDNALLGLGTVGGALVAVLVALRSRAADPTPAPASCGPS